MSALVLAALLGAAPAISLSVAAQSPCVDPRALVDRLAREGVQVSSAPALDVDVSTVVGGLRLRARRLSDGQLLVRTIPRRRSCEGVEDALVTLIREWAMSAQLPAPASSPRVERDGAPRSAEVAAAQREQGAPSDGTTRSAPLRDERAPASSRGVPREVTAPRAAPDVAREVGSREPRAASEGARAAGPEVVASRAASDGGREVAALRTSDGARDGLREVGVPRAASDGARDEPREVVAPRAASDGGREVAGPREPRDASEGARAEGRELAARRVSDGSRDELREVGAPRAVSDGGREVPLADRAELAGRTQREEAVSDGDAARSAAPEPASAAEPRAASPLVDAHVTEPAASPWRVRVAVSGGISALFAPTVAPAGALVVDVGLDGPGVTLDGALLGASSVTASPGLLSLSLQWLTLSGRWRLTTGRVDFDFAVGVRASRLVVEAAGFSANRAVSLFSAGPAAAVSVWVRLVGPLQLLLRVSGALRLPVDTLVISSGPTVTLGAGQVDALAGVALAWP